VTKYFLIIPQKISEIVEEIVFPPLRSFTCECPHFALEEVHKEVQSPLIHGKVAEGLNSEVGRELTEQ
jgi:hypothetical protein